MTASTPSPQATKKPSLRRVVQEGFMAASNCHYQQTNVNRIRDFAGVRIE
jgi:hypothetical protein